MGAQQSQNDLNQLIIHYLQTILVYEQSIREHKIIHKGAFIYSHGIVVGLSDRSIGGIY